MKKQSAKNTTVELRKEYEFDYAKSRPNRFAGRVAPGSVAVVLEPDVASVFDSADAVNRFLRSAIAAMPQRPTKRAVSSYRKRGG